MKHCPNPDCIHLAETGRAGEFRDEMEKCSDCGTALAGGPPPEPDRHRPPWSRLDIPPDPHALRLARAALESAGIPCVTQQTGKTGRMLTASGTPAQEMFVPEHLAQEAAVVLERVLHAPVPLPDDEDLEFVSEDDVPIVGEDAISEGGEPEAAADALPGTCPRCGSDSISQAPEPVGEQRGLLSRLLRPARAWRCLACSHRW